jgi:hypothetical protein
MSDEEMPVIEVGKTGPNIMSTEASHNSICVKVVDENVSNDTAPKKKAVGLQKSTHLLRQGTLGCVRKWTIRFEEYRAEKEESAE